MKTQTSKLKALSTALRVLRAWGTPLGCGCFLDPVFFWVRGHAYWQILCGVDRAFLSFYLLCCIFLHSKRGSKYFRNTLFNLCDNSAFMHKVLNSFIQDLLMEVGANIRKRYI